MMLSYELWKNGRQIICYIRKVQKENSVEYIVCTGKPSDASCLSWDYKSYEDAAKTAKEFFDGYVSIRKNQTLTKTVKKRLTRGGDERGGEHDSRERTGEACRLTHRGFRGSPEQTKLNQTKNHELPKN